MPLTVSPDSVVLVLCTYSCWMAGMAARAREPTSSGRTGTSRQPRMARLSSCAMRASWRLTALRAVGSVGRNTFPTA